MALIDTVAAGRYSATYNSVDVGITQQGYEISLESKWQEITPTDAFGDTIIDGVYRGGNCYCQYEGMAYKAGAITPFWPWGALGILATTAAPIGRLASDVAAAFVMTDTDATPAATIPATLTASKSILAPNNPAKLLFDSRLRTVPTRLQFLPYLSTDHKFFSTT